MVDTSANCASPYQIDCLKLIMVCKNNLINSLRLSRLPLVVLQHQNNQEQKLDLLNLGYPKQQLQHQLEVDVSNKHIRRPDYMPESRGQNKLINSPQGIVL